MGYFAPSADGTRAANSSHRRFLAVAVLVVAMMVMGLQTRTFAQSKVPLPPSPEGVPLFYSAQYLEAEIPVPPLPFNPFPELKVQPLAPGEYVYDDRKVDYDLLRAEAQLEAELMGLALPGGTGGSTILSRGPNDLVLDITGVSGGFASLTLHHTVSGRKYQLLSARDVRFPFWEYGQVVAGNPSGPDTAFTPVDLGDDPKRFFAAVSGNGTVRIEAGSSVQEPPTANPPLGSFTIKRDPSFTEPLEIHYTIAGVAENGADYRNASSHAPLTGVVSLGQNVSQFTITIEALADATQEPDESITLRLSPWHGYLVDPSAASATIYVMDAEIDFSDLFEIVATGVPGPVGMDYNPAIAALVVSANFPSGTPNNFFKIYSAGGSTVKAPWSGVSGLSYELKLATAKGTQGGFALGDVVFGNGVAGQLGKGAASGSPISTLWRTLPGELNHLRGGLYFDRTGIWGYDLLVVSGNEGDSVATPKSVWRVNAAGPMTKVTEINTVHLEGAITLPDDPDRYGPWAGKLLTGDESVLPRGVIYAIDSSGNVSMFDLGIRPEDFDLIPENEDLYCAHFDYNRIVRLPRDRFSENIGDLVITQAGEQYDADPEIFVVHWNKETATFDVWGIPYAPHFEHVTFAPLDLQPIGAQ